MPRLFAERSAQPGGTDCLVQAAQTPRCVCRRTGPPDRQLLGVAPDASALPALQKLVLDFGQLTGPAAGSYVPELHADLFGALAAHQGRRRTSLDHGPEESESDRAYHGVHALAEAEGNLPALAVELRNDTDGRVRGEAPQAIGRCRQPKAIEYLRRLDDYNLDVRLASISALAHCTPTRRAARCTNCSNKIQPRSCGPRRSKPWPPPATTTPWPPR